MFLEVDEDFIEHPKTIRLCRTIKDDHGWAYVIKLWRWCTKYHRDGRIPCDAEELEYALGWKGDPGALLAALERAGFVDHEGDSLCVHDWALHQGRAIRKLEDERERSRLRRMGRRSYDDDPTSGRPDNDQRSTEERPAVDQRSTSGRPENDRDSIAEHSKAEQSRDPDPLKSPPGGTSELALTHPVPKPAAAEGGFEAFWSAYPAHRHLAKHKARLTWDRLQPPLAEVLEALAWWRNSEAWTKSAGEFVPHPTTWLNQRRWQDELVKPPPLVLQQAPKIQMWRDMK